MLGDLSKTLANTMAPIALGFLETLNVPGAKPVANALRDHFRGNDLVQQALRHAYQQAIHTLEVALAGPKFYDKAAVRDFAEKFRKETLLAFLQRQKLEEEAFVKSCLRDLLLIQERDFLSLQPFSPEAVSDEMSRYIEAHGGDLQKLEHEAGTELASAVRNITEQPHALAQMLEFKNVIMAAAYMHFGQAIQKDEVLFRAFFLVNQQGLRRQLAAVSFQLEQARQQRDKDTFQILTRQEAVLREVQAHVDFGLERVQQEIVGQFADRYLKLEAEFGAINSNLTTLLALGKDVIDRLGQLDAKLDATKQAVDDSRQAVLGEIHKLREEILQIKQATPLSIPAAPTATVADSPVSQPTAPNAQSAQPSARPSQRRNAFGLELPVPAAKPNVALPAEAPVAKAKPCGPLIPGFTLVDENTYRCGGQLRIVKEYRHESTGMAFCLLPGGQFLRGSERNEKGHYDNESPQQLVTLTGFLIARYPVTQTQWQSAMGGNPSYFHGDNLPVEQVSWEDARRFCQQLELELPTEAQWEYACRAGTNTRFYWGDDDAENEIHQYCWFKDNAGGRTHPVGEKKPNAFGLYDMNGNVWQWCLDGRAAYSATPCTDPCGPAHESKKAYRGGSWLFGARSCRAAGDRLFRDKGEKNSGIGLRPVSAVSF